MKGTGMALKDLQGDATSPSKGWEQAQALEIWISLDYNTQQGCAWSLPSASATHPGSHSEVWASSASPGPLQTLPAGQGWHCSSAPSPTALDREPGGHGTG